MDKLEQVLNIDKDVIKNNNELLLSMNLFDKLSNEEKYVLSRYQGPSHGMDQYGLFGYAEYSDLFINPKDFLTIHGGDLDEYIILFGLNYNFKNVNLHMFRLGSEIRNLVNKINDIRKSNIAKCIDIFDTVIDKGVTYSGYLYRVMRSSMSADVIYNFTSWSMYPQIGFCDFDCHIYIVKIPDDMKIWYMEYDGNDELLIDIRNYHKYQYEFILPRGLKFKVISNVSMKITPPNFDSKMYKHTKEIMCYIYRIEITEIIKIPPKEIIDNLPNYSAITFN